MNREERIRALRRQIRNQHIIKVALSVICFTAGVALIALAISVAVDSSSYVSTKAFLIGTAGIFLFLLGMKHLSPLQRKRNRVQRKNLRQKKAGVVLLLMSALLFFIAFSSSDVLSRDCTAAVLMTVLGLWMLFTKKTVWT